MLSSLRFAKDGLTTPLCVVVSSTGFWPVEGRMGPVLFPARKNEDPGKNIHLKPPTEVHHDWIPMARRLHRRYAGK
jgi:hypothetical protein